MLSYIYGDPQEQRIAVALTEDGSVRSYSDMRGMGRTAGGGEGDLTSISINFEQGHAFGLNRPAGRAAEAVRFDLDDALDARSLGEPRARMEEIVKRCGGS
ncbi:MAG: hypothetical protein KC645_01670 [Gemmatimonadetes bacterium]|nr:hypothetical protein [Gemmatimonadota bacterium]